METSFYIQLTMKTAAGPDRYGRFDIGNNREAAYSLFKQLQGNAHVTDTNFLSMELVETVNGLPINLQLISCTLDELSSNCRIISKEVFNQANLKM